MTVNLIRMIENVVQVLMSGQHVMIEMRCNGISMFLEYRDCVADYMNLLNGQRHLDEVHCQPLV